YKINDIEKDSEWRFIFIIKFIGIIPNEISSLTFGILNINFTSYMIASILAKTPAMIVTTLIGSNINEPGSLGFIASIIMSIIILIIVLRIYIKYKDNFK
ncbi:MAG: VTT domain-containing protein, partial [Senegalia sp. (in: firmicutes)]